MVTHEWLCGKCGRSLPFKQPEYPDDDRRSEMNMDKICYCGEDMYFDEQLPSINPNTINVPTIE